MLAHKHMHIHFCVHVDIHMHSMAMQTLKAFVQTCSLVELKCVDTQIWYTFVHSHTITD